MSEIYLPKTYKITNAYGENFEGIFLIDDTLEVPPQSETSRRESYAVTSFYFVPSNEAPLVLEAINALSEGGCFLRRYSRYVTDHEIPFPQRSEDRDFWWDDAGEQFYNDYTIAEIYLHLRDKHIEVDFGHERSHETDIWREVIKPGSEIGGGLALAFLEVFPIAQRLFFSRIDESSENLNGIPIIFKSLSS